LSRV
jgi:hypothetical protein